MFSLKTGKPIVKLISRGKKRGKFIYLDENPKVVGGEDSDADSDIGDNFDELCDKALYFQHIPNVKEACSIYIAGPNGSGKSTYAGQYMGMYKKMFPKSKIWVFSTAKEDAAIDHLGVNRMEIDDDFMNENFTVSDFKDSLVLFDDVSKFTDPDISRKIIAIRDLLLEDGRKSMVYVVCTNHLVYDGHNTKTMLNEAETITFFPRACPQHNERLLKTYAGVSNDKISLIGQLPSRWVTIHKRYPLYAFYDHGIMKL